MPAVHHYTSLEGALGILESGRVWFTERAHLNDPSEISHGIQIARELMLEWGRKYDAARLEDSVERVFNNFGFFSASFSFADDEITQWLKYADGGGGIVLSFKASVFNDPKTFIDNLMFGNATAVVCPMSYESGRLRSILASIIQCWDGVNIDELCDHIFIIASIFKEDRFNVEHEYRFFIHQEHSRISKNVYYKTRERDGRMVPYLDLPVQGWHSPDGLPIYRVCVGPRAPHGLEARLADFMRARNIRPQLGIGRSVIV